MMQETSIKYASTMQETSIKYMLYEICIKRSKAERK